MMVVTHAFTGAAAGSIVENPFVAFSLGIIVHIIIDKIPHLLPEEKRARFKNQLFDGILTVISLVYIYYLSLRLENLSIFTGALGGVSVDLVLVVLAGLYKPLYNSKIRIWHTERQYHKEEYLYLVTDLVLIIIAMVILYL